MRKRRRFSLLGGLSNIHESVFDRLRWRFRDDGVDGPRGGTSSAQPVEQPDVPPVNGGPDRDYDSLSSGTIEIPSGGGPALGAAGGGGTAARVPTDPNQRVGAVQPGQQQAADTGSWESVLEYARGRGFNFDPTVTDDEGAVNFLLNLARQNEQADLHARLGRQLAPHADRIREFLGQGQQPQQQAPQRKPWEAPEWDDRWVDLVEQIGNGQYVSKRGAPDWVGQKVNEYVQWQRDFQRNPAAMFNQMLDARAQEMMGDRFNELFAERERKNVVQQITQDNQRFLYQRDQGGNVQTDYRGNAILSPLGAAYLEQLRYVHGLGVTDPRQADNLAKNLVRGQYAMAAQAQATAQQQQAANPATQQQQFQPNRNQAQANPSRQRRNDPAATEPDEQGLSLHERMMRDLRGNGVTDEDIRQSVEGQ